MRNPPCSIEFEQNVLGALFLSPGAFDEIADLLSPEDFYRVDHRTIFEGMRDMHASRLPMDLTTLVDYFRQRGKLEEVGGIAYLGSLAHDTPSFANVLAYARGVKDYAVRRAIIAAGGDMAELAYNPSGKTVPELVDEAQRLTIALGAKSDPSAPEALGTIAQRFYDGLDDERGGGIETGFIALDNMLHGLGPGDLVTLAGRPSMGKSALAIGIADWVSQKAPVAVFSMEMSKEQIAGRVVSLASGVPLAKMKSRDLSDRERDSITWSIQTCAKRRMMVDDRGGLTVLQLAGKARRLHRKAPLALIVVDYLQLMSGTGGNRNEEITEISRGLKCLAMELRCPIIALSQLNRGVEARDNKRPRMSDLRESGAIEQDSDMVLALYRDEYYNPGGNHAGIAECLILKNRNGPTGSVELGWVGELCKFENYSGPSFEERQPKVEEKARGFGRLKSVPSQHWAEVGA